MLEDDELREVSLDFELKVIRNLLKAMSVQDFTTDDYLRERQKAVYEASDFVPKQLKTPKKTGRTSEKKPVKEKKEDTKVTTFKLYKQGHSIKEIAKERDLNQQTIVRHLAHYVAKGMLAVEEFVPEAKADAVREAVESLGSPQRQNRGRGSSGTYRWREGSAQTRAAVRISHRCAQFSGRNRYLHRRTQ